MYFDYVSFILRAVIVNRKTIKLSIKESQIQMNITDDNANYIIKILVCLWYIIIDGHIVSYDFGLRN